MEKTMTQRNVGNMILVLGMFAMVAFWATNAHAAVTGEGFQSLYDFVYNAATGYLGRSIAIIGGIVGLLLGAVSGKLLIAGSGIGLAAFGVIGPTVINTLFQSAII